MCVKCWTFFPASMLTSCTAEARGFEHYMFSTRCGPFASSCGTRKTSHNSLTNFSYDQRELEKWKYPCGTNPLRECPQHSLASFVHFIHCGGERIRTSESLRPTRFPSERTRPLCDASVTCILYHAIRAVKNCPEIGIGQPLVIRGFVRFVSACSAQMHGSSVHDDMPLCVPTISTRLVQSDVVLEF
jgi:hypothetical protein